MRNERGLTLIEVLATITIASVIMGVGFMLFSSISTFSSRSVQKSQDNSSINTVINTISREMADPVELYLMNLNELRFKTFDNQYMALIYDRPNKTLSLYQFPDEVTDIITATRTGTEPTRLLASNLSVDAANSSSAFIVKDEDEEDLVPSTLYNDGNSLFNIELHFELTNITSNGGKSTTYPDPIDVNVTLAIN